MLTYVPNEYLVHVQPGATQAEINQSISQMGATLVKPSGFHDTYLVRLGRRSSGWVDRHRCAQASYQPSRWVIKSVEPNAICRASAIPNDPSIGTICGTCA